MGEIGEVQIPVEIYEEIKYGDDDLSVWAKDAQTEAALLFTQESDQPLVAQIIDDGYANDLTDAEVEKIGRDPFLVAYAIASPGDITVVTTEVSKPTKQRSNRRLPDVCAEFQVECVNTFEFVRRLNFSTNWQTR